MKQRTSKKKKVTAILLTCLIGVLAIGGTLAYLTAKTATLTNNFTFSGGVTATLTEPAWEAGKAADANYGTNQTPGTELGKDPIVTNTCAEDEYVALKVVFQKGDGTTLSDAEFAKLMTMIDIQGWGTEWVADAAVGPTTIYNYNTQLVAGTETTPLFQKVVIKSTLSNTDIEWLRDAGTGLGGFNIVVSGAAIQTDGFSTYTDAKTDLNALFTTTP